MDTPLKGLAIANLEECYATTDGNLDWSINGAERPVDRVASAGRASVPDNGFGIAIWEKNIFDSPKAYNTIAQDLFKRAVQRWPSCEHTLIAKLVEQSLHEHFNANCRTCRGAMQIMAGELKITCHVCSGVGKHRYSDTERAQTMQISYGMTKHMASKLTWLAAQIEKASRLAGSHMAMQLGRYPAIPPLEA